jgi:hypothetical protein
MKNWNARELNSSLRDDISLAVDNTSSYESNLKQIHALMADRELAAYGTKQSNL